MNEYIDNIRKIKNPSFQKIRRVSINYLSKFSEEEKDNFWRDLNKGINLLNTNELMCQYISSYGNMHEA